MILNPRYPLNVYLLFQAHQELLRQKQRLACKDQVKSSEQSRPNTCQQSFFRIVACHG